MMHTAAAAPAPRGRSLSGRALGLWLLAILAIAVCFRLAIGGQIVTPDSHGYKRIADNLRHNGCISYADVDRGQCWPSWGSQPPGYPAFLAVVSLFADNVFAAAAVVQIIVFGIAAAYLAWRLVQWRPNPFEGLLSGFFIALSPLTTAWSKAALTETMAAATTIWVFAELICVAKDRRVPWVRLFLALVCALSMRWEQVWLLPAAAIVIWLSLPAGRAWRQLGVLIALFAALAGAIQILAAALGLPPVPPNHPPPQALPPGLVKFWRTAAVNQDLTRSLVWRPWVREYAEAARIYDERSISSRFDRAAVRNLIERLGKLPDGSAFPADLDADFRGLADEFRTKHGLYLIIVLPLERLWHMLLDPDLVHVGWRVDKLEPLRQALRPLLLVGLVVCVALGRRMRLSPIVWGAAAYAVLRLLFMASVPISALEIRYLTPMYPVLEMATACVLAFLGAGVLRRLATSGVPAARSG
jgi:hypothetical protein